MYRTVWSSPNCSVAWLFHRKNLSFCIAIFVLFNTSFLLKLPNTAATTQYWDASPHISEEIGASMQISNVTKIPCSRRMVLGLALTCAFAVMPCHAQTAENYPTRPVKLVVGFPPGGAADAQARVIAAKLSDALGQQVVVENRPGAGGNIGAEAVAKAVPDGYTILLAPSAAMAINPWLYRKLPYDPLKDFAYVGQYAAFQGVVAVGNEHSIKSVKEMVALARAQPGQIAYGSPGNGTTPHLAGELFQRAARISMVHVPYKGDAPAMTDAIGGQVPMVFVNMGAALPLIKSGKLRALAVTGKQRASSLPDTPTLEESGFPGSAVVGWVGIAAPAKTPASIIGKLSNALRKAVEDPDLREKFALQAAEPTFTTSAAFTAFVGKEKERFGRLIRDARIVLE
jgi:tripartite-type tricarboxylate transporter receptor subunit TctC